MGVYNVIESHTNQLAKITFCDYLVFIVTFFNFDSLSVFRVRRSERPSRMWGRSLLRFPLLG